MHLRNHTVYSDSRLSKLAGKKMKDGNSAITDLSNPNRPAKVGERWSSLYTDEWTDAFDELSEKVDNSDSAIEHKLLKIVDWCYKKCSGLAESQLSNVRSLVEDIVLHLNITDLTYHKTNNGRLRPDYASDIDFEAVSNESPTLSNDAARHKISLLHKLPKRRLPGKFNNKENKIKDKNIETSRLSDADCVSHQVDSFLGNFYVQRNNSGVVDNVIKKCVSDYTMYSPKAKEKEIKFVEKCCELCWYMTICNPPMVIEYENFAGKPMDKNKFNKYNRKGKIIEYVVWPVLLIQTDGPVLAKGTVQIISTGNRTKKEKN